MSYRRTESVVRRLASRRDAIVAAASAIAAERGMTAVQIVPVAERAGIAAGTVYRYFPSKTDLLAELAASLGKREVAAMRRAADAAPGPLSALSAVIATFAARALANRRLVYAVMAEPVDGMKDVVRKQRGAVAAELKVRIGAAAAAGQLPKQDATLAAAALTGILLEGLLGPLAPIIADDPAQARAAAQSVTLLALRAIGVVDARARGLVVQTPLPGQGDVAILTRS
jgi:AcrR family transcriptional regulator